MSKACTRDRAVQSAANLLRLSMSIWASTSYHRGKDYEKYNFRDVDETSEFLRCDRRIQIPNCSVGTDYVRSILAYITLDPVAVAVDNGSPFATSTADSSYTGCTSD